MAAWLVTAPAVLLPRPDAAEGGSGPASHLTPGWVRIVDGHVEAAGAGAPPEAPTIALPDGILAPGLVDLQVNGAAGHDFATATAEGWAEVARWLPCTGVTAFVPTFVTATLDDLTAALHRYRGIRVHLDVDADAGAAARTLGVHVEGPFLNPVRRGAHRGELLTDPTPDRVGRLLDAGGDGLTYVTLAPERAGALGAITTFVAAGVRVAVGHSDASDDEVAAAADAGATLVTHLFNAQRPLHHREPGVVGAALADPRLTLGLIVDLHHVAPTAVRVTFAAAAGRVALVTDAMAALGMPPGRHHLGDEVVEVVGDGPPVRSDGTLAGSTLRLDHAVANAVSCGIDPAAALDAATRVPAEALGRTDLGRLRSGARADLVWLGGDLTARATWIGGRCVWRGDQRRDGKDVKDIP